MKPRNIFEVVGNAFMYVLTATQTKEVFEIISLCLSIVISLLIITSKIIGWYKEAKKDGKITEDEVQDAIDIIKDGAEDIKDSIDGRKED